MPIERPGETAAKYRSTHAVALLDRWSALGSSVMASARLRKPINKNVTLFRDCLFRSWL